MYRAVAFDLFGTLVDNFTHSSFTDCLYRMADALGAPRQPFWQGWMDTYEPRNRGQYGSTQENITAVCRLMSFAAPPERVAAATAIRLEYTRSYLIPRAEALPTLTAIRESGGKLALVSDCAIEVPTLWPDTPFAPLFDVTVFSCRVKTKKPDPVMYLTACKGLGVRPDDCLYVGDGSSSELTGAAAVGMHPVLIRAPHEEHPDSYRPNEDTWTGPMIRTLSELLGLL